jgi:methylenetetrahydrofolate dehydrogenase (NADP+) / methenyltetrahydrofolate cyclohydrolase
VESRGARLIDGKRLAASLRIELASRVSTLLREHGIVPGLAVILVGDNSALYVKNKVQACASVGVHSMEYRLPFETATEGIVALIATLNATPSVHGILV